MSNVQIRISPANVAKRLSSIRQIRASAKVLSYSANVEQTGPQEMPGRGFEPLRIAPPDPKSGASANFATLALEFQILDFGFAISMLDLSRFRRAVPKARVMSPIIESVSSQDFAVAPLVAMPSDSAGIRIRNVLPRPTALSMSRVPL
jgi:hypothetical protein